MRKTLTGVFNLQLSGVVPGGGPFFLNYEILKKLDPDLIGHPEVELLVNLIEIEYQETQNILKERKEKAKELRDRAAKVLNELSGRRVY